MRFGVKVRFRHYVRDVEEHDLVEREWVTTANFDGTIAKNALIRECEVSSEIPREVKWLRATFSYRKKEGGWESLCMSMWSLNHLMIHPHCLLTDGELEKKEYQRQHKDDEQHWILKK